MVSEFSAVTVVGVIGVFVVVVGVLLQSQPPPHQPQLSHPQHPLQILVFATEHDVASLEAYVLFVILFPE